MTLFTLLAFNSMSHSTTVALGSPSFPPKSNIKHIKTQNRRQLITLLQKCKHYQIPQLHAKIIRTGLDQDPFVVFELLRLCSNLTSIDYAVKVFRRTQSPNVYLYTALIDGLVSSGYYSDAIRLYFEMVDEFIVPDKYAITSALKACGFGLSLKEGRQVHAQAVKLGLSSNRSIRMKLMGVYGKCGEFESARHSFDGMPERDVVAATVMISCYGDCGLVEEARGVFERLREKDTVCWTAMIDALVKNGEMNGALEVFREMQRENVRPNEVTLVCVLTACSHLGALELGRWVRLYMDKNGIEWNCILGGALINMYSRCGDIYGAIEVFSRTKQRDVSTYNSMIEGLAMHGKSAMAIEMFGEMMRQGLWPNSITFVKVLNACSHGGLVELGFEIFYSMTSSHGVQPHIEHYGCMVDLLARSGQIEEAYSFIERMKMKPDHIMLGALLSACKIHGNSELGEKVAEMLVHCDNADSGTYVLLSNVYAASGKWKEAAEVRALIKEAGTPKEPGCSLIEVNNEIHEFLSGDIRHPQKENIYRKLEELNPVLKREGYLPATEVVLHDIGERQKEWALAIHSERLAICYGLISTKPSTTLRIVKNLRVCNDCHSMIKLIAKITKRKIIMRDRHRFHHFENGACSCGDYW